MISYRKISLFSILLIIFSFLFLFTINNQRVSALSGSDFNPGRIIDDSLFYNDNSMTVQQIQQFLNSKVPICDTNGTKIYSGSTTRAQYGASKGYPAPYTCLKDYSQNVPSVTNGGSDLCKNSISGGIKSAAQIIHDAAKACGINPQVLIVMLQKEMSLITDDWPWTSQYDKAMGYACPDSGPNNSANCDSVYFGFFNQVYNAAKAYRRYEANPNSYNYRSGRNNYILYNPNTACGGSNVFIENQATASLYIYTPYQPNQAALNNLYGTGDGCSAYGNRNFWRMFNDWFGSTYAVSESWEFESQEIFNDSDYSLVANPNAVSPGKIYYTRIKIKNTGPAPWKKGELNLAVTSPNDKNSPMCTNGWLNCNRPATLKEEVVEPSDIGTFEFPIIVHNQVGITKEYFRPVLEGKLWLNHLGLNLDLNARYHTFNWRHVNQSIFSDSSRTTKVNPNSLNPRTTYFARINLVNYGNVSWTQRNKINLGTSGPLDRNSVFCSKWITCNRPASLMQTSVAPGEVGTFEFELYTPSTYGVYKEYFRPVVEGVGWMNDIGLHFNLTVKEPTYDWDYVSQKLFTDNTKSSIQATYQIRGGSRYYTEIKIKNIGNTTWKNTGPNVLRLGTSSPTDRISKFCDDTWIGCNRTVTLKENTVDPGEIGTFEFWIKAPYSINGTEYREYFRPVVDGITWLKDIGLHYKFIMSSPDYEYSYISQGSYSDTSRSVVTNLFSASLNTTYYLRVNLRNTGGAVWNSNGATSMRLGTSGPNDRISIFCDNSWLTCNRPSRSNQDTVAPGEIGTFDFSIKTPTTGSGSYNEYFRPVVEGRQWLTDIGILFRITY